jgi:succinyl-CoA synthetase beta subunit
MKIHEYQAKEIFRRHAIPVPRSSLAGSAAEAGAAARALGGTLFAVKAQVHAGGRGKGGGVRMAHSVAEVESAAAAILQNPLVTPQTGPAGVRVAHVLVEEGRPFDRQLYAGVVLDRAAEQPVLMVSAEGGVEIEVIAREKPDAILKVHFDPQTGLAPEAARQLAGRLGLTGHPADEASAILTALARIFLEQDCSLLEINPLVVTKDGHLLALDAKCTFDDNALFRHADHLELRDRGEEDPREAEAADYDFSYVSLDGDIGCMVNGAGLAMATNDIITIAGGRPANFLDVGGAADPERVTSAFRLLLRDPRLRAVLVNIFGGIVRCDVIAQGIITALKAVPLRVPLVVRLEGTNVDVAREMLRASGLAIIEASGFRDAAEKAVAAARGGVA